MSNRVVTVASNLAKNQTTSAFDCTSIYPLYVQAVNNGAALTAGTLKAEISFDNVNWDATTFPISLAYTDIEASVVKSSAVSYPFIRFTAASWAFTYGKTQTTGTGLSDLTIGGSYTALVNHTYYIKISTADTTDKFQWKKDDGAYSSEVACSAGAHNLSDGVTVTFAASTGHVLGDVWTVTTPDITVRAML